MSNIQSQFVSKVRTAGIPTLDSAVIHNCEIPLPPLPIQEKIVEILDKFSTLSAELEGRRKGLPAEIQKVQQQYEYYRNLLLNFEMAD